MRVFFLLNLRHPEWRALARNRRIFPPNVCTVVWILRRFFDSVPFGHSAQNDKVLRTTQWSPLQGVGVGAYDDPFSIFLVFRDVQGAVPYILLRIFRRVDFEYFVNCGWYPLQYHGFMHIIITLLIRQVLYEQFFLSPKKRVPSVYDGSVRHR